MIEQLALVLDMLYNILRFKKTVRHFNSFRLINSTLVALYLETHLNIDKHLLIFDRKLIRMYQNTQLILSSM